jgi:hypothetical protein
MTGSAPKAISSNSTERGTSFRPSAEFGEAGALAVYDS